MVGVGEAVGEGEGVKVGVGVGEGVMVGDGVGDGVSVSVGTAVGDGIGVGEAVGCSIWAGEFRVAVARHRGTISPSPPPVLEPRQDTGLTTRTNPARIRAM